MNDADYFDANITAEEFCKISLITKLLIDRIFSMNLTFNLVSIFIK